MLCGAQTLTRAPRGAMRHDCVQLSVFSDGDDWDLTLLSTEVGGFSFLRGALLMSSSLTASPRAFKESVCPAASESEIDLSSRLGFRRETLSFGKCFTRRPSLLNRQHSVIKERRVGSRHASFIVPDTLWRFILSSKEGGFLAAKSVSVVALSVYTLPPLRRGAPTSCRWSRISR